jgi:exosome complex component RRP41
MDITALLGMLSAAINATSLALVHAGISITRPVASLAVSAMHDVPLLDPSATEETDLPTVTIACLAPSNSSSASSGDRDLEESRVTLVNMETRLSIDRFEGMLKLAVKACKILSQEMNDVIRAWTQDMSDKLKSGGAPVARHNMDRDADEEEMEIG